MSATRHDAYCSNMHEDYVEHCDPCKADHDALMQVLAEQADSAQEITTRLTGEGIKVPTTLYASARVEALVEALLVTRRARMAYEYAVGDKVVSELQDAQRQLANDTDSLLVPVKKPGHALHLP